MWICVLAGVCKGICKIVGKKRATKFHKPINHKALALYSKSLLSKVIGWGSRIPHPSEVHVNQ